MKRAFVGLLTFLLVLKPHAIVFFQTSLPNQKLAPLSALEMKPEATPSEPTVYKVSEPSGGVRSFQLTEKQQKQVDACSGGDPTIADAMARQIHGLISAEEAGQIIRDYRIAKLKQPPAESAKTFVASLAVGSKPSETDRVELDRDGKKMIKDGFRRKTTLRFGGMAPLLSPLPGNADLAVRAAQAYRILAEAALAYAKKEPLSDAAKAIRAARWNAVGIDKDGGRANPRVVFLTDNNGHPALATKGNAHLIGSSGKYREMEAKLEAPFGSHYVTLTLVESAIPVLGVKKGMAFLSAWVAHETLVLKEKRYVAPTPAEEQLLTEGYRLILKESKTKRSAYARLNAEDRKFIDGIVSHNAVAREILAKLFKSEMPVDAAKLELVDLGFKMEDVQKWCGTVLGETPLTRATLNVIDAKGAQLLAASL